MLYRLLRNNKESGPYTASQLKEMGLKPYDLLWPEGRGAAWQYASEITELKSFAPTIEEQPFDRFFKKKEQQNTVPEPTVVEKRTKPRFRISGDKVIMVEAGTMEIANTGLIKEVTQSRLQKESTEVPEKIAAAPGWQDIYTEYQPPVKEAKKEEPVEIKTKYSESLDDIKKRYADKVLSKKADPSSSYFSSASFKQNITAAVALLVIVVGGYIGYTLKKKDAPATVNGSAAVERADVLGDNHLSNGNDGKNELSQPGSLKDNEKEAGAKKVKPSAAEGNNKGKTPVEKSPSTVVAKMPDQTKKRQVGNEVKATGEISKNTSATNKTDGIAGQNSAADSNNKTQAQPTANTVNNPLPVPVDTRPVAKPIAPKKIGDYITVKKTGGSGSTVENVRLMVSNVTDFPIDLAVVDIQYFDSKGKYQKGETMYVKNINGGNNVEVRVPDSEKAHSIKYKVSLVSAEQKTLYLVAE